MTSVSSGQPELRPMLRLGPCRSCARRDTGRAGGRESADA
jgi:hypothetical protein